MTTSIYFLWLLLVVLVLTTTVVSRYFRVSGRRELGLGQPYHPIPCPHSRRFGRAQARGAAHQDGGGSIAPLLRL